MWKFGKTETYLVSINSPSGEGGGAIKLDFMITMKSFH